MSTSESCKSPKHKQVTRAITAAAAAAFKAFAQMVTAAVAAVSKAAAQTVTAAASKAPAPVVTALKALEKMAFMVPE